MSHDSLVKAFIKSDSAPDGKWWVEVPVGISLEETTAVKHVDAVCLTSREFDLPEVYPERSGTVEYVNPEVPESGVNKTELFRRVNDQGLFEDETVTLVECKSGKLSLRGVGQLVAYETLITQDWNWEVDGRILVCEEVDPLIHEVCKSRNISVVEVSP
ncbi:hypothetical protein [Haloplanus natans]|uniref:hypothetical protein n=1 Tax=Haloplanus natans TaxID=376171 RepID=UPI000677F939|nr:hypothetical protein [Haloplanus natans]